MGFFDCALILNSGSSSLKFSVYRYPNPQRLELEVRGQIDGIGRSPRLCTTDSRTGVLRRIDLDPTIRDPKAATDVLASWLRRTYDGAHLLGVGHRVVHGGPGYARPVLVTREVLIDLFELMPLAPLHQPHNLAAIERIAERLPEVPQVACFDTSFHLGHAPVAKLVPLPEELRKGTLQRYGFHGLSYEYIASVLPNVAPEIADGRVIVAHLGNGASLCGLKNGVSIDSTLGFTALDGLCMGTRPGALDPGVVLYLFQSLGLSAKDVELVLYQKSGLLGISGISSDMRDLLDSNDSNAKLAVDYFVYRAAKEIGSMAAVLGGLDGLVFTAGIGENSSEIRRRICDACSWLGLELDPQANAANHSLISSPNSRVVTCVIPTNEELMIARHTTALLGLMQAAA